MSMTQPASSRKRQAHALFFPAAALYAAIMLPASLQIMLTQPGWLPGLATGLGHGHEMLFGYALAVVAGYLLGPLPSLQLYAMFGLWLLARASYLIAPGSLAAATLNALFALLLAVQIAPKFMTAAKKWRNQAIGPVLLGICGVAAATQIGRHLGSYGTQQILLLEAVLLLALLMLFMGGRVIAPAVAGQFHKQGIELEARVQPGIEGALIIAMGAAILLAPLPAAGLATAAALAAAGVLAAVRLLRWRLWELAGRSDLLCLGAGYGWLAIGLLLLAAAVASGSYRVAALHVITVGALGSLSIGIMARVRLQRVKADPAKSTEIVACTALVGIAAATRVAAGLGVGDSSTLLWLAALSWSLAFLLLARLLYNLRAG